MIKSVTNYFKEAVQELELVRWPTRQQAVRLSIVVLVFTLISSAVFGFVDFGLAAMLRFALSFVS